MPEMSFAVRWPDGTVRDYYSPSLVIHDHLTVGDRLSVAEFRRRATDGLTEAGERVRERYGFLCSSAADTAARVASASRAHPGDALVEVVSMHPPLPSASPPPASPPPAQAPSASPDPQEHS
ncbi:MAG: MSMEG_0570 family nitrogen starvation response protein [Dietzia sp.]|nr:MSMEG_0570 family nitrogen starvation response protein [Dietzia sp.]MBB1042377.1 MSMEG_0570 family nitrogen starvation response protein [Dietzia sp. Cai40]MDO8394621.1 MSMEG_0570 family nitrogen starvation response protein [Dietzia sp.]